MKIFPALSLLLLIAAHAAWAADDVRTVDIRFPAGKTATTLKGVIVGRASISYKVGAEGGQTMSVTLRPSNRASYFNVYEPGRGPGDQALASSEMTGPFVPTMNRFVGKLESSGVYTIDVFLYRAAARRNERSDFSLTVALAPAVNVAAPVQGDFADGLQGGPDYWRVSGLRSGALRLRREPSSGAHTIATFRNGEVLRNAGCRMSEGGHWCKVALPRNEAVVGWIDGRYLEEGARPGDALVAGTDFHATGEIACAQVMGQPTRPCRFGVVRRGGGLASVTIFVDAGPRTIQFEADAPSGSNASAKLSFRREADLFLISIGDEHYEIPEAVITGG